MSSHEQTDLFGGTVPLEELDLAGHSRRLATAERERGHALNAVEAGQLIHAARGKHPIDQVCTWCGEDGSAALVTLGAHRARIAERHHKAATEPPWTCQDCEHENPPGSTFCRGCASTQEDEPRVGAVRPQDPEPPVSITDDDEPPVGGLLPRAEPS